jgi:hypothetical protein
LARGQRDLKTASGNLLPIVAQLANPAGASLSVTDGVEQVLQPLVTFNLPESYELARDLLAAGIGLGGESVPWASDQFQNIKDALRLAMSLWRFIWSV